MHVATEHDATVIIGCANGVDMIPIMVEPFLVFDKEHLTQHLQTIEDLSTFFQL